MKSGKKLDLSLYLVLDANLAKRLKEWLRQQERP